MPEPTYRLSGLPVAGDAPDRGPNRTTAPVRPVVVTDDVVDVDAQAEHELSAIVEEERRETHDNDLLNTEAPEE
jgi:hypothetical protein